MQQTLSTCRHPSDLTSALPACDGLQDKVRIRCKRKQFKGKRKLDKANFVPAQIEMAQAPQEEDWEREIEEFSRRMNEEKEKQMSNKAPYDPDYELKVALCEMSLYSVPHALRLHQDIYHPSTHHPSPVKWIRAISYFEMGQFADAEE